MSAMQMLRKNQVGPYISALYSIDNIVIGTISFAGKPSQSEIKYFKLSIDENLQNTEFPGTCSAFEASGFDRDRVYNVRLHAYTSTEPVHEYISEIRTIQVSGVVTGLYPTVFVQWEAKERVKPSPVLAVKWAHIGNDDIEEYLVYLNQSNLPIKRISREEFLDNICVLIAGVEPGKTYHVEVHERRTDNQIECSDPLDITIPKTPLSSLEETYQSDLNASSNEYPVSYAIKVSKTEPAARKIDMAKMAAKFLPNIPADDQTSLLSAETQKSTLAISSQTSLRRESHDHLIAQQKDKAMCLLARLHHQIRARKDSTTNGYPHSRCLEKPNYSDA